MRKQSAADRFADRVKASETPRERSRRILDDSIKLKRLEEFAKEQAEQVKVDRAHHDKLKGLALKRRKSSEWTLVDPKERTREGSIEAAQGTPTKKPYPSMDTGFKSPQFEPGRMTRQIAEAQEEPILSVDLSDQIGQGQSVFILPEPYLQKTLTVSHETAGGSMKVNAEANFLKHLSENRFMLKTIAWPGDTVKASYLPKFKKSQPALGSDSKPVPKFEKSPAFSTVEEYDRQKKCSESILETLARGEEEIMKAVDSVNSETKKLSSYQTIDEARAALGLGSLPAKEPYRGSSEVSKLASRPDVLVAAGPPVKRRLSPLERRMQQRKGEADW